MNTQTKASFKTWCQHTSSRNGCKDTNHAVGITKFSCHWILLKFPWLWTEGKWNWILNCCLKTNKKTVFVNQIMQKLISRNILSTLLQSGNKVTVWKFWNFSAIQILREIKFWDCHSCFSFKGPKFYSWQILAFKNLQIWSKSYFGASKMSKLQIFELVESEKFWNLHTL